MSYQDLLQVLNILVIGAGGLGYIIVLERRLMKIETRLEVLLDQLEREHEKTQARKA